jgi:rRNA maturation endonuclease Nob1
MKKCSNCGAEAYRVESKFCLKCGVKLTEHDNMPIQNICTNSECEYHKSKFIYPDDARFCDICGSRTVYAL